MLKPNVFVIGNSFAQATPVSDIDPYRAGAYRHSVTSHHDFLLSRKQNPFHHRFVRIFPGMVQGLLASSGSFALGMERGASRAESP